MNQLFGGSVCLTELIEQAKKGHSAFSKAQNGKVYFNILSWLNDKEDKFGNTMSHQLGSKKDMRDKEEKIYIGNSKKLESSQPIHSNDIDDSGLDNIPERKNKQVVEEGVDDLPF